MKIFDGHAHIDSKEELEIRQKQNITTFLCGTNPLDSLHVEKASNTYEMIFPTYGLHPWYADQYQVEDMIPFIKKGNMLGEIGMDSVWCDVSLERQKKVFLEQLALAEKLKLPVVLHTKGQEKEILDCIRAYSLPILVHWYSCEDYLQGYIDRDCYFTVGSDVFDNHAVQSVVEKVGLNRLLVETDGFSAVKWALEQSLQRNTGQTEHNLNLDTLKQKNVSITLESLSDILLNIMEYISSIKNVSIEDVSKQMESNFMFLNNYKNKC